MNARNWFERLLENVADRGRELISLAERGDRDAPSEAELCHRLLEGVGEASNIALAREILQRWQQMDDGQRLGFLQVLASKFDPDPTAVSEAAAAYRPNDPSSLQQLMEAIEPPRQELMRRLNMAPGGTATLVDIRAFLLKVLPDQPQLQGVDADFRHLLASWFNRGFLHLTRIDWNSPAAILEKLIRYEAVHPMSGWEDLRRRLGSDRRCFAFFHPALPTDPLIFVEVALTREISNRIAPLIDPQAPEQDPQEADCAVFYSINNALSGLRGVSFGNFLLKQVVSELTDELPNIKTFVTLSPIPRMRDGLLRQLKEGGDIAERLNRIVARHEQWLETVPGREEWPQVLDQMLTQRPEELPDELQQLLSDLALFYLTQLKRGGSAFDPVAHFHLSNGARLERINPLANTGERGLAESWGCMVNYRYLGDELVANHESYACDGQITLSRNLDRRRRQLEGRLEKETVNE